MPLYLGDSGDDGDRDTAQRSYSTETINSIDPDTVWNSSSAVHPRLVSRVKDSTTELKGDAELTLIALTTLFARTVGLSLVRSAPGVLGHFLVYRSVERWKPSLLMPLLYMGGCGARSSHGSVPDDLRAEVA